MNAQDVYLVVIIVNLYISYLLLWIYFDIQIPKWGQKF